MELNGSKRIQKDPSLQEIEAKDNAIFKAKLN